MLIALQGFRGERPASDARQLDSSEAQVAENCNLWTGVLRPWHQPLLEQLAVNAGPILSIFRYTAAGYWLHWDADVDVVHTPIAGINRVYWTGDGVPKMGNVEIVAGVTALTATAPGAQNYVLVGDTRGFGAGDSITITLDSGSHTTTITTIQASLKRLNLNNALPSQASVGKVVVNNNKGYPHGFYALGVPSPTAAPATALTSGANKGTVTGIAGGLGQQTGTTTTANQNYSIDLAGVDSDGALIDFQVEASFTGNIASVQNQQIIIRVFRDPGSANEKIFEHVVQPTYQGPAADDVGAAADPAQMYWYTDPTSGLNLPVPNPGFTPRPPSSVGTGQTLSFQFTPADGAHTYRLSIEHGFVVSFGSQWTYNLRLAARRNGEIGVVLNTASHNMTEGDKVQFGAIIGTGTLSDLNKGAVSVLSVDGATVYVDSQAAGAYTSGGTWEQVWDEEDLEARTYVYTYVVTLDGQDMEGPPSAASAILNAGDNRSVTVSSLIDPTTLADDRPYSSIRIYRTVSGSTEAEFQFVAEVAVDAASYVDTQRAADLDEILPSQYREGGLLVRWDPPPTDMQGITELPNGRLAAFRGNELLFCVPGQPQAWPVAYRHTMHDPIVAIGSFGTSVFVGTEGRPVIATGTDPAAISEEHIEAVHPCESKRATVDMGYAILFPSKTGLVMVAPGEASIVTGDLFNDDQWEELKPSSFIATKYGTRYVFFFDNGTGAGGFNGLGQGGYILDPRNPKATLTRLSLHVTEIWNDPRTDDVYLVVVNANGDEEIAKWNANKGAVPLRMTWRSKEFTSRFPVAMGVVKVDAERYPVRVNVYGDGALYDAVDVQSSESVRISTERGEVRKIEVEVIADTEVEAVYVAANMAEIVRYASGVG